VKPTQTNRLWFLAAMLLAMSGWLLVTRLSATGSAVITPANDNSGAFTVTTITDGLEHPWSMAFLPDGRMLVTERPGRLRLVENGRLDPVPVTGLPAIRQHGQGGLLDVVLHPDYESNGWIYFSYAGADASGIGTEVGRGRLKAHRIVDWQLLFNMQPKSGAGHHFGSRLVFDRDGYLFITLGERGERFRAQDLDDHAGSVIRLHDDGRIPADNPFVDRPGARPEIYSYGHRNVQGAALHPVTGELWTHEHGPQGGDELNIIRRGRNYGWPVITYGKEYGTGFDIGEGTHKKGMEQPLYYWVPSIAPSGMAFYTGDRFPDWQGNLFIGSLKFQLLVRLTLDGRKVIDEQRLLQGKLGRIRDVRSGPDGYLYLLTDADNGKLVRLEPLD
jgi:glucose/arabinose dehydrogenase